MTAFCCHPARCFAFKKIHEVYVLSTCGFDLPAGVDPIHGRIDYDLE